MLSGGLALEYYVSGIGQITKAGGGTLMLQESYNEGWSGGLVLSGGRVAIGSAVGDGIHGITCARGRGDGSAKTSTWYR